MLSVVRNGTNTGTFIYHGEVVGHVFDRVTVFSSKVSMTFFFHIPCRQSRISVRLQELEKKLVFFLVNHVPWKLCL